MGNIFNPDDKNDILNRLDELHPESKPLWGKMNVSQMLAHCIVPSKISLGEIKGKRNLFGILFGKTVKKRMVNEAPFKKNLPTDPSFIIRDTPDFYKNQQELKEIVQKIHDANKAELTERKHPFFGKMTADEWGILSYKHLDHHLKQFGV